MRKTKVSSSTIRKIIPRVCNVLIEELADYVKLPETEQQWLEVSHRFEERWQFPHAIGAIDGKHVRIRKPTFSGSLYYNYKNYFSIVLLAIVDADYNFMYVDIGGKGGVSDGGVFRNA
ncbi:uncharacterized protein LOC118506075 [Anopheles stephensi]|uniref:uncharacterized protein LOC118506075 n=1 Tax=Anopheles stephensi TaxID=30069 RepID=UPI001658AC46|nr:uncharacterized protein LOC118506075 [Anopheles stephensi]